MIAAQVIQAGSMRNVTDIIILGHVNHWLIWDERKTRVCGTGVKITESFRNIWKLICQQPATALQLKIKKHESGCTCP